MKTVWTLNKLDEELNRFDYEIFKNKEGAIDAMNRRKEVKLRNHFDVYYENDRMVTLIPEEYDEHLVTYTYKMWINEQVVH